MEYPISEAVGQSWYKDRLVSVSIPEICSSHIGGNQLLNVQKMQRERLSSIGSSDKLNCLLDQRPNGNSNNNSCSNSATNGLVQAWYKFCQYQTLLRSHTFLPYSSTTDQFFLFSNHSDRNQEKLSSVAFLVIRICRHSISQPGSLVVPRKCTSNVICSSAQPDFFLIQAAEPIHQDNDRGGKLSMASKTIPTHIAIPKL